MCSQNFSFIRSAARTATDPAPQPQAIPNGRARPTGAAKRHARTLLAAVALALSALPLVPQESQGVSQERLVRFSLWAQLDSYPGYFAADVSERERLLNDQRDDDKWYSVPVRKIREVAPFLVGGMVHGWRFTYTPYDRARGVEEVFEFTPVAELTEAELGGIGYRAPWAEGDRLSAWVEYRRTAAQEHSFRAWSSVMHPRIRGTGYARLSLGFEGIRRASEDALKDAVRSYERTRLKTKPKEVSGMVLVREPPLIGIDAGRYRVTLDFFMETDRIVDYRTF